MILETKVIGNYRIEIHHDECSECPRNWDNIGTLWARHRRYNLCDDEAKEISREFFERKNLEKFYIVLPVYMYEHGNILLSTSPFSCPWDSGQLGFIYASKEKIRKEFSVKKISKELKNKVFEIFECELKTYSQYLNGECYGYKVFNGEKEVDSCWGYYEFENCIDDAKDAIEYDADKETKSA